jgi:aminoglycoside 6'-N-acetyltransferase I
MDIRPGQTEDAEEWLRLRMALWPDSSVEEQAAEIQCFLAGEGQPDVLAAFVCPRAAGGLCGLVEVSIHQEAPGCKTDRIGYLEAWYVDPDLRRMGVGRALVAAAEDWARSQGCREMASDTTLDYPLSPRAHAQLGYPVSEVENHFCKDL